ncbi:type VI secretion-associated protein (plasmid) [Burkholderia sp. THE68]|uniref:type VI secretion system protein TssA n=1 Tax=Burkholderia sp. THE68 TaxID=758782 RepID=UPI0013188A1B|nr:type VI secretion system protein TssA [Burkholderia sp. THE68]BBU32119.1 type VI secretion-associated protein [Burkholderia sp. THE68]
MFTNLLNALFGTRKPSDLAIEALPQWHDWLTPIRSDTPVGDDPGCDDEFLAIKDEVAKLSSIDDALIVDSAERLIKSRAKDVRLAVYYVYGRLRRDGAEGVAAGFELLSALVDRFGDTLLPARAGSRRAAFEWLCSSTFADRLDAVQGLNGALLERTLSALALISERIEMWPEDTRPSLAPLFRRFESRIESPPGDQTGSSAAPTPATSSALSAASEVTSTRELLDRAREMAQFLREQPQGYLAAYRLMRCVRWDTLTEVPPFEAGGKTRLVAPRAELRANLKRLLLQKQWPELLERVEAAFAEGANHFWLDLQYYAFVAQEQAGGEYAQVRESAATDCALMLERLPGLEHLSFSDGSSFADDATLEWIARYATVRDIERGETAAPVAASHAGSDWAEIEAQAIDTAAQQGIGAALAWLQRQPAQDDARIAGGERERFTRQLVMARVAERAKRSDTALYLLGHLDADIERFQLARWEPSLAFEAKHHLLRILKSRFNRKDADKTALSGRIDSLTGDLTAIDAARAVALI